MRYRYVRTSEGSNEIRTDGLGKRTYIANRREAKYSIILYNYSDEAAKPRAEFRSRCWSLVRMEPQ